MSDKHFFYPVDRPVERGPRNVTVNEHRAPTDESIRLYSEMVDKAKKAVEKTVMVQGTEVNATIWQDYSDGPLTLKAKMKIGGHEVRASINLTSLMSSQDIRTELAKALAMEIAVVALTAFDNALGGH
jgi:hypothetical protein